MYMFFAIMKGMNNNVQHKLQYSHFYNGSSCRKPHLWATLNAGRSDEKTYNGWSIKQIAYNYAQDNGWAKYKKLVAVLEGLTPSEKFAPIRNDYDVFDPS